MTWRVFSTCYCKLLKTRSFHWRQIIQGKPLLRKNQIWLNLLSVLHKGWLKKHCIIEKKLPQAEIPLICKELPNDVGNVLPPVLSQRTTIEHVFNGFHWSGTTMWATFVNLCWDFATPFIYRLSLSLMDDRPKGNCFFLCLNFMPNIIPLGGMYSWIRH